MASRSLDDLHPGTRKKYEAAKAECAAAGHVIFECSTYRAQIEQDALYAQGREPLPVVNELRKKAGLPPITEAENKDRVTWTRHSTHSERRAVDYALKEPKSFDLKADYDKDGVPDFTEIGRIMEKHGLQWGIVNRKGEHVDLGHVQDNEVYPA